MPPASALAGWAARHGQSTEPRALFVLARAIARRGKKGRFFMRRTRLLVRRKMKAETIDKMAQHVERVWRGP